MNALKNPTDSTKLMAQPPNLINQVMGSKSDPIDLPSLKTILITIRQEIAAIGIELQSTLYQITQLQNYLAITRQSWKDVNAERFTLPENSTEKQKSKMVERFVQDKQARLEIINVQGKRETAQLKELIKQGEDLQERTQLLQEAMANLQAGMREVD